VAYRKAREEITTVLNSLQEGVCDEESIISSVGSCPRSCGACPHCPRERCWFQRCPRLAVGINALAAKKVNGGYADAALRWTSGSQLLRTRQQSVASRRRTLMSRTSGPRTFLAYISSSASILTKFAGALRGTSTSSPLPVATTGTFSTGIGVSSQYEHACERRITDG
jgi:hypothetical protein